MIVLGGSLGSMAVLRVILQQLLVPFPLPLAVVLHRHKDSEEDLLISVLQRDLLLPVKEVEDKEPIRPGHVQVGPPDYHLLVESKYFSLSTDEPIQYARPSIDVLFESAADVFGERAIGVVLTGANHDGAEGAREIRRRGGTIIVQDPSSAECAVMPAAALAAVADAHVLEPRMIGRMLNELAAHAAASRV